MNFKTKGSEVTKFALSFEELEHLYTLNFGPDTALELVRDIFLVGCYTGLRISDYGRIKPEHIKETDGQHLLTISQQKTGSDVVIPLLPIALSILKKYDFHIPDLPSLTMNNGLKKLGQAAGYNSELRVIQSNGGQIKEVTVPKWKKITSHVARRSFATNFYRAGIPIAIIMKITGHKSEAMFMKYIAIDATENALKFAELAKSIKP
jgi:integrase